MRWRPGVSYLRCGRSQPSGRLSDIAVSRRGKTIYAVGVADVGPGNMIALTANRMD